MKEMKFRRIVKESNKDILKEIERMYGVKTARALEKYCAKKGIDPERVVNDTSTDRNGMCEWDKFDVWAQKQGVDFAANFGDVDMDSLLGVDDKKKTKKPKGRATKIYDRPSDADVYGESGDQDENDVLDFITDELNECEWVKWVDFDDYDATCTIGTSSGKAYDISVKENTTVQIDDED